MASEGGRMSLANAVPERAHLSPKAVRPATAECKVGVAKEDITPPVGVYNRLCVCARRLCLCLYVCLIRFVFSYLYYYCSTS